MSLEDIAMEMAEIQRDRRSDALGQLYRAEDRIDELEREIKYLWSVLPYVFLLVVSLVVTTVWGWSEHDRLEKKVMILKAKVEK